jgi:DNA-binding MarR family transcriptional regulator
MIRPDRADQLNQALELMYFGFRGLVDAPDRLLSRRGLGRMHHRVLYFIARSPGLSVGDLLLRLAVTKQALNRPLRDLVSRRLVTFRADRDDRRVRRLALSKAGAALEQRLSGMQRAHLARIFEDAGRRAEAGWRTVMQTMSSRDSRLATRTRRPRRPHRPRRTIRRHRTPIRSSSAGPRPSSSRPW